MSNIIVIGGGAAGMMAAISASDNGHTVTLIEKNEKLGKKIYITGKGRCNVFNACTREEFMDAVSTNSKFMYGPYSRFGADDSNYFFNNLGLNMKIERGNRVFPVSDHASDVTKALTNKLKENHVKISYNTIVNEIITSTEYSEKPYVTGVKLSNGEILNCDSLIVATGGLSYPTTGSTGDGLKWAKKLGLSVNKCIPSLVALNSSDRVCENLAGLSLKNVSASFYKNDNLLYSEFGEMLFTHHGVSGPIILTATSKIGRELYHSQTKLIIDFKPKVSIEELDKRLLKQIETDGNKSYKNAIGKWIPKSLETECIRRSSVDGNKSIKLFTRQDRYAFLNVIKNFELNITGLRDFNEAIITKGGVDVKEINAKSMMSKKIDNLYFAGEVLDLDAVTGGFNLQIAWTTGYVAGTSVT